MNKHQSFKLQFIFFVVHLFFLIIFAGYQQSVLADSQSKEGVDNKEKINIIATIQPIQLLVQSVVGDLSEVELLVNANFDIHDYQLKISDLMKMNQADIIFYVHPQLEQMIVKASKASKKINTYALFNLTDSQKYLIQRKTQYLKHALEQLEATDEVKHQSSKAMLLQEHEHEQKNGHKEDDHLTYLDTHVWLDPDYVMAILDIISEQLSKIYPQYSDQFNQNKIDIKQRINQSIEQARIILAPIKDLPYLVFHDAFRYFSAFFELNPIGSISDQHHGVSAKKISQLRQKIDQYQIICIFSQDQFVRADKVIKTIIQDRDMNIVNLNPMANSSNDYSDYLLNLAQKFKSCLNQ